MRLVYAAAAVILWTFFMHAPFKACRIPDDIQALTVAIVAAGALAGGN